jgi:hypothetical protein
MRPFVYTILVDHFATAAHGDGNRQSDFLRYTITFLERGSSSLPPDDRPFAVTVICSVGQLPRLELHSLSLVKSLLVLCDSLLAPHSPTFSDDSELIVSKAFRHAVRLIARFGHADGDVCQRALSLQRHLTMDVRHSRLFENYLFVVCSLMECGSSSDLHRPISHILSHASLLAHAPLSMSQRAVPYVRAVLRVADHDPASADILGRLWPLVGCFRRGRALMRATFSAVTALVDRGSRSGGALQADLLDQLVAVLDLLRADGDGDVDARLWLRANVRTMRLILALFGSVPAVFVRAGAALRRVFCYVGDMLDIAGAIGLADARDVWAAIVRQMHAKDAQLSFRKICDAFAGVLERVPEPALNHAMMTSIREIIPSKASHTCHRWECSSGGRI